MKIGNNRSKKGVTKPEKNTSKKNLMVVVVALIAALLIAWVFVLGKKAERTVSVVMLSQDVYKNQCITESMIKEYKMIQGEFEKYAVDSENGKKRRIVLWEEAEKLIGMFAAYPLQADTVAMYSDFIYNKTDNSNTVLYSYPGKNIVQLGDITDGSLEAFKTFLQPGDRINITAIFSEEEEYKEGNEAQPERIKTYREETVFNSIILADLLNQSGDSILDMYASYNDMTTYEQAALDSDETWKENTKPAQLLVALTPDEETLYYKYLNREGVQFKISLPQRID